MSDSEDDLIAYGTPLEPLEEDEIPNKKPRLLEDQVVKDKQGRRRFHGAFTGGFSAGFFNTVGSLEGWSPSSFKSSKSKKQRIFLQKPEDFMDDEDLSEFGIAPLVLKAKQDYTTQSKSELAGPHKLPTLGNYVLQDLLKPVRETVGIKLLRKMGWKPGQGVGSRLNRKEKENILKMRQKIYGCQLLPEPCKDKEEYDPNSDSDSEWDYLEFAPSDCEPILCEARNDSSGLGYEGLEKRPVLSGNFKKVNESAEGKNQKFRFCSQAFGVGAFEEEDEDIYARDDMTRYDFVLESDFSGEANKSIEKLSFSPDGVLEGFVLETKKRPKRYYTLPTLPKDFTPQHKIRHSRFDPLIQNDKDKRDLKINLEDRRKINLKHCDEAPEGKKQTEELISNVNINENPFKPFSSNPEKQERYENYLKLIKIGKKELLSHLQPISMNDLDRRKETVEFEKAALLFKPLTGGIESRFLTARQSDDFCDPLAVVEKYVDESDDRKKAAKMNMFGSLTRKTDDWVPAPLLCKRFNIPEPNKGYFPSIEEKKRKCNFNLFDIITSSRKENTNTDGTANFKNSPRNDVDEDKNESDELNKEKKNEMHNKKDLFKSIFLASESEDELDDKKKNFERVTGSKEQWSSEQNSQNDLLYEEKLINSKRNLSPPSGIFENIDLESLSNNKKVAEGVQKAREHSLAKTVETDSFPLNLIYGPKIPEKVDVQVRVFSPVSVQDDAVWVEKKSHIRKKHKKKDKSNKKNFHKSKHKHKKRKR